MSVLSVATVAVAAGLASVLRFLAGHHLDRRLPWGTITVNVVGSFVIGVVAVNLLDRAGDLADVLVALDGGGLPVELVLRSWQLPELLGVVVDADGAVPTDLQASPDPFAGERGIAVPVVPEVC